MNCFYQFALEMEARKPDCLSSSQQTSEVFPQLDEARGSHDLPKLSSTNTSSVSQYASLQPLTPTWEIPREHVTIERVIGKGAFGQVAKGTVIGLRGRPMQTPVAVKMLKGANDTYIYRYFNLLLSKPNLTSCHKM